MTHQIPSHLAFCTPGQNKKKKNKARDKSKDIKEKQTDTKTIIYFSIKQETWWKTTGMDKIKN